MATGAKGKGAFAAQLIEQMKEQERRDKIERYKHLNRIARKGQILFCGSSLMEQFPVHELLVDAGLPLAVYNRGVGGYTTAELIEMLDVLVFELEPSHIFINIGTNDMNEKDYRVENLMAQYEEILTRIRQVLPEVKFWLMAYYPCNKKVLSSDMMTAMHFRFRTNDRVREANEALKDLASRFDAEYLDLNSGITDQEGELKEEYAVDGIHMYGDGYMKVFEQLLPVLQKLAGQQEES